MTHEPRPQIDAELVRSRLTMVEVCTRDGLVVRKVGGTLQARCPFHEEKKASFVIAGRAPDRAHCFGCGWDGDIYKYWMERKKVGFVEAKEQLASLCGVAPSLTGVEWTAPKAKVVTRMTQLPIELREKPPLPPMRMLKLPEMEEIAATRGLSLEAVRLAAETFRRVGFCEWPMWQRKVDGRWVSPCETHYFRCKGDEAECAPRPRWPSWVATDGERRVAEFRRLDDQPYPRKDEGTIKAWATAGKNWPLGAAEMGRRMNVLIVEGGPDMLAAYHFLLRFKMVSQVAVVCMLGGSNRIAEEALPYFQGRRVRIMMDADLPKDSESPAKRRLQGLEAAARWTEQLKNAGVAAVKTYNVGDVYEPIDVKAWHEGIIKAAEIRVVVPGLVKEDGTKVKDVNDLAYCSTDVIDSNEVHEAFTEWKEGFGG